jgi:hypothetical protein
MLLNLRRKKNKKPPRLRWGKEFFFKEKQHGCRGSIASNPPNTYTPDVFLNYHFHNNIKLLFSYNSQDSFLGCTAVDAGYKK